PSRLERGGSVVQGWHGVQEMALGVWVGLVVLLSALAFRQRRRRVQGVMASLTLSCFAFTALGCGTAHQRTEAPATVTYLHQGVSPGPVMITDAEGQVVTERRYEPFGSPIDSLGRDGQVISGTDFHVEPWNSLNKETDP